MRPVLALLASVLALVGCAPPEVSIDETPIRVTQEGEGFGAAAGTGDSVRVDYRITLPDGREVLRQRDFEFKIGTDSVIRGIDEAIIGMRPRGWRVFECPPHKHWGRAGYADGLIPPATNLTIDLKLVEIVSRARHRASDTRRGESG